VKSLEWLSSGRARWAAVFIIAAVSVAVLARGRAGSADAAADTTCLVERGEFIISHIEAGEIRAALNEKITAPRVRGDLKIVYLWPEGEKVNVGDLILQFDRSEAELRGALNNDSVTDDERKAIEAATRDMTIMTGQKPVVTRARRSIATFKLREGMPIGVKVTLRGNRMWDFLDRLINIVLPRQRDFQGISPDSFDGRGNYSLGLREQLVFPEIDYDEIDKVRGLEVTIVTTSNTDEEARRMLALLDMPFKRG